jgi:DNA gyrase inhibitor GyrI
VEIGVTMVDPPFSLLLGVSENPDKTPEHKRRMYANVQVKAADDLRGDKGSHKN